MNNENKYFKNNGRQLEPKINQDLFTYKIFAKLATEVTNTTTFSIRFQTEKYFNSPPNTYVGIYIYIYVFIYIVTFPVG